jgi:hypothetical protein
MLQIPNFNAAYVVDSAGVQKSRVSHLLEQFTLRLGPFFLPAFEGSEMADGRAVDLQLGVDVGGGGECGDDGGLVEVDTMGLLDSANYKVS